MTRIHSFHILSLGAIAALAAGLGLSANTSAAKADVMSCRGTTPNAVVSCCNAEVRAHGRPIWMRGGGSCGSAMVVCKSGGGSSWIAVSHVAAPAGYKKCKLASIVKLEDGGNNKGHNSGGKGGQKGPNNPGKP